MTRIKYFLAYNIRYILIKETKGEGHGGRILSVSNGQARHGNGGTCQQYKYKYSK
jgi:hypothetical protein